MSHEDKVFGLLIEANPIPAIEDLDLVDVGGQRYLAALAQKSSEVTQTDARPETPKNAPGQRLILGLAASLVVVLTAAALLLALNDDDPVVATTAIPTETSQVELQGQGNRNSRSFELEAGSYSVETTVTGDCSYTFELSRSGTGHMVEVITSISGPGTTTVILGDVRPNSYFVRVDTDTEFSCPWSMEFARS